MSYNAQTPCLPDSRPAAPARLRPSRAALLLTVAAGAVFALPARGDDALVWSRGHLGFKSAEDTGGSLDAWFNIGPPRPVSSLTGTVPAPALIPGLATAPDAWSTLGHYRKGRISADWNFVSSSGDTLGLRGDSGWMLGGAYRVGGGFDLGFQYGETRSESAARVDVATSSWNIYGDWQLGGGHRMRLDYTRTLGTTDAPLPWSASARRAVASGQADLWQLLYEYAFSKRTTLDLGYSRSSGSSPYSSADQWLEPGSAAVPSASPGGTALGVGLSHSF